MPNTKDVIVYNNRENSISRHALDFPALIGVPYFLPNCAYVNTGCKVYISGGLNANTPSDSFICYDGHSNQLTRLPEMLNARYNHSMYAHNDFIFFVGGNTSSVERFDCKSLKFTKLSSSLTDERNNPVLYVYNNYLYTFFGTRKGEYLDTVERLNLKNVKSKWEVVAYLKKPKDLDLKMIGCGIIQSGEKEIYLFGGKSDNGLKNTCLKFDFGNNSFESLDLLLEDEIYFHESVLSDLGDFSYGQFNLDKSENFFRIQLG